MASGYFPLERGDDDYYVLLNAASGVKQIARQYLRRACRLDQFDNAARDGTYIGYLEAAAELIRKCLREEA